MPAIIAFFFLERMVPAAALAIPIGMIGSTLGLLLSYYAPALPFGHAHDEASPIEAAGLSGWPTGPSIVAAMGTMVILAYLVRLFIPERGKMQSADAASAPAE